jgi:hypothetical protein
MRNQPARSDALTALGAHGSKDIDPEETRDWLDGLNDVIERDGMQRAEFLVDQLIESGRRAGGRFHTLHTTPYRNSISVEAQPPYPGDLDLELHITAIHRWNALAMVMRANQAHPELGGHIATYASIADLFEVGFHHFFRAPSEAHPGDLVYFQPHAVPSRALGRHGSRLVVLPPSVADARFLAVSHRLHGARPADGHLPGALPALPPASRNYSRHGA